MKELTHSSIRTALKEDEPGWRDFFNATSEAIFVHDVATGCVVDVNDRMLEMYGVSREEALNMSVAKGSLNAPPYSEEEALAWIRKAVESGPQLFDWRSKRKNGELFWCEVSLRRARIGAQERVLAVVRDTTKRKQAEEALQEIEDRYQALFERSRDCVFLSDFDGKFLDANQAALDLLGYEREEIPLLDYRMLLSDDQLSLALQTVEEIKTTGYQKTPREFRLRRRNGEQIDVEIKSSLIYKQDKPCAIQGIARDITERKRADEEVRSRESLLINVLESTADGILVVDPAGKVLAANRRFRELWHVPDVLMAAGLDELLLAYVADQLSDPPEFLSEVRRLYQTDEEGWSSIRFKDGRVFERYSRPVGLNGTRSRLWSFRDITKRMRAEEELRASEERFRDLSSMTTEGIVIHEGSKILDVNQAIVDLLGFSGPDDLIGKNGLEVLGFTPESTRHLLACMNTRSSDTCDVDLVKQDGTIVPVEMRARDITYRGREARLVYMRDVTERKRAEEALRRQAAFDTLLNTILARFASCTGTEIDGAITTGLQGACEFIGADLAFVVQVAQDLVTWTATHEWRNPDAPSLVQKYQQIHMGTLVWLEQQLLEGKTIQLDTLDDLPPEAVSQRRTYEQEGAKSILDVPMCGRGKRVIGCIGFRSYFHHIHWSQEIVQWVQMVCDAIANVLERRKTEEALAEREKRYRSLFDLSPSGILLEDSTANILEANPAMCRIFGYSHDELCGRNVRILVPPERHSEIEWHLDDLRAGKTLFHEIENVGKDGQRLRVEIHEMSVPLSDGRRGILAVVNDITERRQLEEQLRHLQKMELVGQLAAGVSHDFNNILTVINGSSSILMGLLKDSPECMEWVTQILAAGERATNLTRQLLLFSRKQQLQPQTIDLNELTSNLTKMLGRVLGEDITLQFSYETDLPAVQGDPGMLEQVIINLAVNARDAMPHGGRLHIGTSTVSFTSAPPSPNPEAQPGRFVRVSVLDTGSGIPPEVRERIFEPFFTTKEVGKGTGLGLATVFGIVTQHRGWIEVDSTVGQGTTFHIYLPACASPEPRISGRTALPSESGCGKTILVVEDEASVRELIFRSLKRQGYMVMTADSGAAAQRLPHEQLEQVDLLVSDLVMPGGVSGRDLAESLRRKYPRLRVIYLSGYSPEIMGGWLSLEHGVSFIQKPFTPQELLNSVAECLQA